MPAQTPEAAGKVVAITGPGAASAPRSPGSWRLAAPSDPARTGTGRNRRRHRGQRQPGRLPASRRHRAGGPARAGGPRYAAVRTSRRGGGAQQPVAGADLVAGGQLGACLGLGALRGRRPLLIPAVVIAGADACRGGDHLVDVRAAVGGGPSARSVSYQNCWSSGNSSGLTAMVSVVFLPSFLPSVGLGIWDLPTLPAGSAAHVSWRLGASCQGRAGQAGWVEMITWSGSQAALIFCRRR